MGWIWLLFFFLSLAASQDNEAELYKPDVSKFHFIDSFDEASSNDKWVRSKAAKYDGVWKIESPERFPMLENDLGLVMKSKAKHAAISSKLNKKYPFTDKSKPFVFQYEVTIQNVLDCGGSYVKLLSETKDLDLINFNDQTPYTIMFGPDKCGNDMKLHFIFRHTNPLNGTITEKHCKKSKERLDEVFKDKLPHLYQLVINPDNTFQISLDHKVIQEGSLLTDFTPPVNPPKEIDDPEDKKPESWDEREKIPDPDAIKPSDWNEDAPTQIPDPSAVKPSGWLEDEPEVIPDPNAQKPEDWETEIDGEWEAPLIDNPICDKAPGCGEWKAPLIDNPEYKGKWQAPLIDNPNYQGKWFPKRIPNPDYFEDLQPFAMTPIVAVGIEIWSMTEDILFDNILITDDVEVANEYAANTFDIKMKHINKESESVVSKLINYTNENSWLWGVYIVVIGTPLSFLFYTLCCATKDKSSKETASDPKKTDESTPDDEEVKEVDDNEGEEKTTVSSKKTDLDVKATEEDAPLDTETNSKEETILPANEEENTVSNESGGARKRKPRKE